MGYLIGSLAHIGSYSHLTEYSSMARCQVLKGRVGIVSIYNVPKLRVGPTYQDDQIHGTIRLSLIDAIFFRFLEPNLAD